MKKQAPLLGLLPLFLSALLLLLHCSQDTEPGSRKADLESTQENMPAAAEEADDYSAATEGSQQARADSPKMEDAPEDGQDTKRIDLSILPLSPSKLTESRMLEYTVNLSFESESILESRKIAFETAQKYGFLSSSRTYNTDNQHFQATIRVSAERLHDALKDLEKAGTLIQSSVDVTDHTADRIWQGIKLDRERIRSRRRQAMQNRAVPENQIQAENLLAQSEDSQDAAKFEDWKIQDRVQWATVNISVQGPEAPESIEVPNYVNALVGLTNNLLALIYWMLENILLIIVLLLLIWQWKRIWKGLKRMVGKDSPAD